jgi:hypothetical protein
VDVTSNGIPLHGSDGDKRSLAFVIDHDKLADRSDTNAIYAGVLRVRDDSDSVVLRRPVVYFPSGAAADAPWPYGLWVGRALMNAVTFADADDLLNEEPTAQRFPVRLIVHYSEDGRVHLLSRVVGVPATNEQGESGYQLYTDERSLPDTDGEGVFRVSSPAFGMMPPLRMQGAFLTACTGAYTMAESDPLNPFRHQYNPELTEGVTLSNTYTLIWSTNATAASLSPWNPNGTCSGTFRHEVRGLRRQKIAAEGPFTLERVSGTGGLDGP